VSGPMRKRWPEAHGGTRHGGGPAFRGSGGPAFRGRRTPGGPSWAGVGRELGHLREILKKIEASCQGY
jgi:hypothetical protein